MIYLARPTVLSVANIVFTWKLFCFEKWGRTYVRTYVRKDDMCENNDHFRPWLWVGRVDQKKVFFPAFEKWTMAFSQFEWIFFSRTETAKSQKVSNFELDHSKKRKAGWPIIPLRTSWEIISFLYYNTRKTEVINDPLSQSRCPTSGEHYFHFLIH